jgi:outer membrane protein OmpA-like peptidoglycan-associated protein
VRRTRSLLISSAIVPLSLSGLLLGVLIGCAKPMPQALVDARAVVEEAGKDADVVRYAPVQLDEAQQAVKEAEALWYDGKDTGEAEHQAYLVLRRVEIARAVTAGAKAVEESKALARQREAVLLEIRTAEADRALAAAEKRAEEARLERAAAEKARAEAEQAQAEAAKARAEAAALAASEQKLREELAELQAQKTERGIVLTLGDVLFDVDEATLKAGATQSLARLVGFLKEYPDRQVLVEGHTDSTGTEAYNLELSQRRADAVVQFLSLNGIAPERAIATGYGTTFPVATNETAEGRQRNRRVEIVILDPGEKAAEERRPPPPQ